MPISNLFSYFLKQCRSYSCCISDTEAVSLFTSKIIVFVIVGAFHVPFFQYSRCNIHYILFAVFTRELCRD